MKRVGLIPLFSAGLFVASAAYAQTFDGEWRGSGGCGIGNIDRYTITLSVKNATVVGTASSFGQKSGALPDAFAFRGQIDSATGSVALSEAASRYDGKVTGRQMVLAGSASGMTCRYTLAYVGTSQVAAALPNPQPAAPAPAVQDRAPPAPERPAMVQVVPAAKSLPSEAAKPSTPADPMRTAFIGQSPQDMASVQRALAVLSLYRGDLDGVYGPGTAGAIDAWQRSQGLPPTGYLTVAESDRLRQQALAHLGGSSTPSMNAQPVAPKPQVADAEPRSATGTPTLKVGTVFSLSLRGPYRTVVAVAVSRPGSIKVDYQVTPASASEVCQREQQLKTGTASHRACVNTVLSKNGQVDSLVVDCRAKTITTGGESYQRDNTSPNDDLWSGTVHKNYFIRADANKLYQLSCGQPGSSSAASPSVRRVEWSQLRGTWVPQEVYSAERCSGTSPYPPPDLYLGVGESQIALFEGGCNITEINRTSETTFRVSMQCGEFNLRNTRVTQLISLQNGRLTVDGKPYVHCKLRGLPP